MDARAAAHESFDSIEEDLVGLSHRIHATPELGYEEVKASQWLCELLDAAGFDVDKGVCELETAFVARAGSGPLHIAFCAEYDCLPDIGHACGHNVIAAMSAGAGIAAARAADEAGLTVSVIGTPAEEGGGGKIVLLDGGAFEGVHAAMMAHPAPFDIVEMKINAAQQYHVTYTGKTAHASAFPERGVNAQDALTVAQVAIGLLRQQIRPTDRIHGICTRGGEAPNIIPARVEAEYMVRAAGLEELDEITDKVMRCLEAGALASGAKLETQARHAPYAEMRHDSQLAERYRANVTGLGRELPEFDRAFIERTAASTDMGNVSLAMPSIHPAIGIDSLPAVNHQPEFAAHCVTEAADRALRDGALALAFTAIDAATDEGLRERLTAPAP